MALFVASDCTIFLLANRGAEGHCDNVGRHCARCHLLKWDGSFVEYGPFCVLEYVEHV